MILRIGMQVGDWAFFISGFLSLVCASNLPAGQGNN
jgi:hypothetical protein